MKHIFILNPTSGKGVAKTFIQPIKDYCDQHQLVYKLIITEFAGHAKKIAHQYTAKDDVCLYAVGGDGTLNEIINGINHFVPLALIPAGTGNDYSKMLGGNANNPKEMIQSVIEGKMVYVDYASHNNLNFHNCCSMGLDAQINALAIKLFHKLPIPRKIVYGIAAFISVLNPQPFEITLQLKDRIIHKRALLIAIMNGKRYGGGFNATPLADIQDGLLDICIIEPVSIVELIYLLPKYFKGKHAHLKQVQMLQADTFALSVDHEIPTQTDGENSLETCLNFSIIKNGLYLKVPQNSNLK